MDPAVVVALALAAGIIARSLARHLRPPGIIVLLAGGVLRRPDGIGILDPGILGDALQPKSS
jgi:NhaP-type Na+/H+ or K+/H+ antiporter